MTAHIGPFLAELYRLTGARNKSELAGFIGVGPSKITAWEGGHFEPTLEVLLKIRDRYHVGLDYLMGFLEGRGAAPPERSAEETLAEQILSRARPRLLSVLNQVDEEGQESVTEHIDNQVALLDDLLRRFRRRSSIPAEQGGPASKQPPTVAVGQPRTPGARGRLRRPKRPRAN